MPSQDVNITNDPLNVEVAKFLGMESGHWSAFLEEIKAIRAGIEKMPTTATETDIARQAAQQFYVGGVGSPNRSVANQPGTLGGEGPATEAQGGMGAGPGASTPQGVTDYMRAVIGAMRQPGSFGSNWHKRYGTGPIDRLTSTELTDEGDIEAWGSSGGGGASRPPDGVLPDDPIERAKTIQGQLDPITVPRTGHFTVQNAVDMYSRRYLSKAAEATDPATAERHLGMYDAIQGLNTQVLPPLSMIHQAVSQNVQQVAQFAHGLTGYGESMNAIPGDGGPFGKSLDVGPVRIFNPATWSGAETKISDMWQGAVHPGLTSGDISTIRENLSGIGSYEGASIGPYNSDQLNTAFRGLTQYAPQLGNNPLTAEMASKTLRYGTTSLDQFIRTMKDLPEAAKRAGVGIEQFQSDIDALAGPLGSDRGGTPFQGMQTAMALSNATGAPPAATTGLLTSEFGQGMLMARTGIPPWAQGTLPGTVQAALGFQGFKQGAQLASGIQGTTTSVGGIKVHTSAAQQQAAYLHEFIYPDMDPQVLQQMVEHPQMQRGIRQGQQFGGAVTGWQENYSNAIDQLAKNPDSKMAQGKLMTSLKDLRTLRKDSQSAINPITGKKLFDSGEFKDLIGGVAPGTKIGDIKEKLASGEVSTSDLKGFGTDVNAALQKAISDKLADQKKTASDVPTTIELGPKAQQFFTLNGPQGTAKEQTYAGYGQTVNGSWGQGPTRVPSR